MDEVKIFTSVKIIFREVKYGILKFLILQRYILKDML